MRRASRFSIHLMGVALALLFGPLGARLPQGERERFFPETGYAVREPFLAFFEAHGGLRFLGYPITPALPDPPYQIQCFQFACLRWDPLASPDRAVQPIPIAEMMGLGSPPIPSERIPLGRPFRRYIPETGHTVSAMFLAFWLRHGGARGMGNPITEPFIENGRLVQVFQGMKVMWDPAEQTVRPMNLGETYAQIRGLNPRIPARIVGTRPELQVQVAIRRPVVAAGELQTVIAFVRDAEGRPIPQARVRIEIPGHEPVLAQTDEMGMAQGSFIVGALPSGSLVEVRIIATDGVRQAEFFASFRVWP